MGIIHALMPIVLALAAGFLVGRLLAEALVGFMARLITPLVWLLLFLIGLEFGEVISSAQAVGTVLKTATLFALGTTVGAGALILIFDSKPRPRASPAEGSPAKAKAPDAPHAPTQAQHASQQPNHRAGFSAALKTLKECVIALGMVALGALCFVLQNQWLGEPLPMPSSHMLLLLLVFLVGIDLTQVRVSRQWLTRSIILVPVLTILGSLLGGLLSGWMLGEPATRSMQLASGFGWFTLSSVMVGQQHGQLYGSIALMTDLLRELIAIALIYTIGKRHPEMAVGTAGATALDSTLPMIKQGCSVRDIPLALASGFILSLLAPILLSFLGALSRP